MNILYIIIFFVYIINNYYVFGDEIDNNEVGIGYVSRTKLKQLINWFINQTPNDKVQSVVAKKSSCVVLIYTISDECNNTEDDNFYNSCLRPRMEKKDYKYGVTSGVIVASDGIVVTTYDAIQNSDRYIVSVDSEKNQDNELYGEIKMTTNTYEANVVRLFPELNLAFLKIKNGKIGDFDYLNVANTAHFRTKNEQENYYVFSAIAIGKCKGEHYVRTSLPYNSKNKFDMVVTVIGSVALCKSRGVPILILYTPVTGEGAIPENHGGAIINSEGKLIGISCATLPYNYLDDNIKNKNKIDWLNLKYNCNMNLPFSFAIPSSTIKQALSLLHSMSNSTKLPTKCGITVKSLLGKDTKEKQLLIKKFLQHQSTTLKDDFVKSLRNNDIFTKYPSSSIKEYVEAGKFGVVVTEIMTDSIAFKAGIQIGDIILKFNNECIADSRVFENFENISFNVPIINLTLLRNNQLISLELRK